MRILLIGCSGFLGSALAAELAAGGHSLTFVTHSTLPRLAGAQAVPWNSPWVDLLPQMDAVINLAGCPLADCRWTESRKRRILSSRLNSTRHIGTRIAQGGVSRLIWINASAVGFYGDGGARPLDEQTPSGTGFLADVCKQWEDATRVDAGAGVRCMQLRTGMVLSADGGYLKSLLPFFRLGLGGPLGLGQQYVSWIHRHDWVRAVLFLLEHPVSGPVNLVAPHALPQREFARTLGRVIHRPAFLPLPALLLRLVLGEMSSLLLEGQNAQPAVLQSHGFSFAYPELKDALQAD